MLHVNKYLNRGAQCERPEGFCLLSIKKPTFGGPPAKSKSHANAAVRNAFDFELGFELQKRKNIRFGMSPFRAFLPKTVHQNIG